MGTTAGLLVGLRAANLNSKIVAVRVIEETVSSPRKLSRLVRKTAQLLRTLDPSFPEISLNPSDLEIRNEFLGPGYAHFTDQGIQAAELMREHTGIILSGTYSAKAFAALIRDAGSQRMGSRKVLFWNTYNSRDLTDMVHGIDYRSLPEKFHRYFEMDVQPLDRDGFDR